MQLLSMAFNFHCLNNKVNNFTFYFRTVHVSASLGKSMNLEKFGNCHKAQPNGSANRIFPYYQGGVTIHFEYLTNQET